MGYCDFLTDGTPEVTYIYDSATLGICHLRSVTAAGVSTYQYTAYDPLGRPLNYSQQTGGVTYNMSCHYNRAGLMTDETYPNSSMTVYTDYDNAGRIAGVRDGSTQQYYAGNAPGTGSNIQSVNGSFISPDDYSPGRSHFRQIRNPGFLSTFTHAA